MLFIPDLKDVPIAANWSKRNSILYR